MKTGIISNGELIDIIRSIRQKAQPLPVCKKGYLDETELKPIEKLLADQYLLVDKWEDKPTITDEVDLCPEQWWPCIYGYKTHEFWESIGWKFIRDKEVHYNLDTIDKFKYHHTKLGAAHEWASEPSNVEPSPGMEYYHEYIIKEGQKYGFKDREEAILFYRDWMIPQGIEKDDSVSHEPSSCDFMSANKVAWSDSVEDMILGGLQAVELIEGLAKEGLLINPDK